MSKKHSPRETEILDSIYEIKINFKPRKFKFDSKQQELLSLVENDKNKIIWISGAAGTSKTYLAIYSALLDMKKQVLDEQKDIIYVRSVVESASKSLGALPGSLDEKFSPYMLPLEEKLREMLSPTDVVFLKKQEKVKAIPVNFLRGANWNDKFVIIDEAQNLTHSELTTLLTRVGKNSKLIICGDPMQSDIGKYNSGFKDYYDLFSGEDSQDNGIQTFKFNDNDIYRSKIVKFIVKKLKEM